MSRSPPLLVVRPCRNGYSHRPDEFASAEHIWQGVAVLAEALRLLS